jgi:hypothetical protein
MGDNGMIPILVGKALSRLAYSLFADFSVKHRISEILFTQTTTFWTRKFIEKVLQL